MNEATPRLLHNADNCHRLQCPGLVTTNKPQVKTAHMHNTVSDKLTCIINIKYLSSLSIFLYSAIINRIVLAIDIRNVIVLITKNKIFTIFKEHTPLQIIALREHFPSEGKIQQNIGPYVKK